MYEIVKDCFGIMQKDLFIATGRIFGFSRIGDNITQKMEIALQYLLKFKLVVVLMGKLLKIGEKITKIILVSKGLKVALLIIML